MYKRCNKQDRFMLDLTKADFLLATPEMFDALMYDYMRKVASLRPTRYRMSFLLQCYSWQKTRNQKSDSILENDRDNTGNPVNAAAAIAATLQESVR